MMCSRGEKTELLCLNSWKISLSGIMADQYLKSLLISKKEKSFYTEQMNTTLPWLEPWLPLLHQA